MQTNIHPALIDRDEVREADGILRNCVHCGFCTAVCPTYQLLGDELDGPRGRIYLIKNMLEADHISREEILHIDRCLTCRACETACPSGVEYGRLLDIGREIIQEKTSRPVPVTLMMRLLRYVVPYRRRFALLLRLGRFLRPVLPSNIARKVPPRSTPRQGGRGIVHENPEVTATVLLLDGCVQSAATPGVNESLVRLLQHKGIAVETLADEGCCGALDYHLSAHEAGRERMRTLIDQIYPRLGEVDAVVSTASGCGVTIKEYPAALQADLAWHNKAREVADKVIDVSELLAGHVFDCRPVKAVFHSPCSLVHGQKISGVVESILADAGIDLAEAREGHLCCGSAGAWSIMQPKLAESLLTRKLDRLQVDAPEVIATANIGCQMHLQSGTDLPVMHWVELLDRQLVRN